MILVFQDSLGLLSHFFFGASSEGTSLFSVINWMRQFGWGLLDHWSTLYLIFLSGYLESCVSWMLAPWRSLHPYKNQIHFLCMFLLLLFLCFLLQEGIEHAQQYQITQSIKVSQIKIFKVYRLFCVVFFLSKYCLKNVFELKLQWWSTLFLFLLTDLLFYFLNRESTLNSTHRFQSILHFVTAEIFLLGILYGLYTQTRYPLVVAWLLTFPLEVYSEHHLTPWKLLIPLLLLSLSIYQVLSWILLCVFLIKMSEIFNFSSWITPGLISVIEFLNQIILKVHFFQLQSLGWLQVSMANGMISFLVALVIWAIIKQWNQSPFLLKFSFLKSRKRMFFVICILGIIIRIGFVYSINPIQKVSLHQLSVGQGDSLLYQQQTLQGQITGMVDVGSFYRFKVKDWLEVLNRYQVQQMDWLILTHLDEDHAGNLLKLLSLIPVKCVVIQEDFFKTEQWSHLNQTIREWGLNIRWAHQASDCELPSNISVMDLSLPVIKVLHKKTKRTQRGNQTMLGVQIQLTPDLSYYNFGDASKEQEMIFVTLNQRQHQMGNQYQRALSAALRGTRQNPVVKMPQTILKLSHHGSKYSTAEELLALFQETSKVTAWVSVGHNTYGHPHPRVLQTLNQRQIPLKRTDLMGDLSVECVQIDLFQWYHCGEKYINDR